MRRSGCRLGVVDSNLVRSREGFVGGITTLRRQEVERGGGRREGSVQFRHRRSSYLSVRGMGVGVAGGELGRAARVGGVCRVEVFTEGGVAVLVLRMLASSRAVRSNNLGKRREISLFDSEGVAAAEEAEHLGRPLRRLRVCEVRLRDRGDLDDRCAILAAADFNFHGRYRRVIDARVCV